jgi:hypothetical protein
MSDEKTLYTFTVTHKIEKSEKETTTDDSGAEITKTVKKTVDEPITVTIKRPTRRQEDEAEEEYAVQFSKFIKKGLMTKAMLANKYSDNGGLMSDADTKEYGKLLKELSEAKDEYTKLSAFADSGKKKTKKIDELSARVIELTQTILRIENRYQNLFELTAETKADSQRLLWYALNLSYIQDGEKTVPLYAGNDLEEKRESYYQKEENPDEVYSQVRQKLWLIYAVWQYNRNATPEELAEMIKSIEGDAG